jgi:hypothetical protein
MRIAKSIAELILGAAQHIPSNDLAGQQELKGFS